MRLIIALALLLPSAAAAQAPPPADTGPVRIGGPKYLFTGQEDPLLLVRAFERTSQLIVGKGGWPRESNLVLCIGLSPLQLDPPLDVLRRLGEHEPRVVARSECRSRLGRLIELATGRDALLVTVSSLEMRGDTTVVYSNYWSAPLAAAGWICRATKGVEGWVIERCEREWVS